MSYSGLNEFIASLEQKNDLIRIKQFVNPELEITEVTDRIAKAGGKALLFENTGTKFPVLINAFGSDTRMAMAIGRNDLTEAGAELEELFRTISGNRDSLLQKLSLLPYLGKLSVLLPAHIKHRGKSQANIHMDPDLGILPVLKCWPHDGGRFFTLPMVHTVDPENGITNVGMYRMQVLDRSTTGMHWQRHKTGASHFEAWKRKGGIMPVTVTLGGDPVYTYAATAPLPQNINEYMLAGFLRKKKVKLVKCLTNDLWVPEDADIVIEGYVDPSEEPVWEGPFGDHTGFYSLADWYPKFHVTCITHSDNAVYPATIVGIPPMEDSYLAKATERLFLSPVKMTMLPEVEDFHMPDAGVAHNLVIVKIRKSYPGQGMKVLNSLSGAGQMMFTKYMIVVDGNIDIRNYRLLASHVFSNTDISTDIVFSRGPLDVLDHSSDNFSFGGKAGIDATVKHKEELSSHEMKAGQKEMPGPDLSLIDRNLVADINADLIKSGLPVVIASVDRTKDEDAVEKVSGMFAVPTIGKFCRLIVIVDKEVDVNDLFMVAWQLLGNTDPQRDHRYLGSGTLLLDATVKAFRAGGFPRGWPNIVCSADATIRAVDSMWNSLSAGAFISSPSLRYSMLNRSDAADIVPH